jgi:catechol 2,3-dioxygenase-like lactoylglutathione lyase family enzyme
VNADTSSLNGPAEEETAMRVAKLQHYNIRTTKFDETVAFYRNILGMKNGIPPGAPEGTGPSWIYDDSGEAIVHLTSIDPVDPEKDYIARSQYRGGPDKRFPFGFLGSGSIDHVALSCEGWDEILERIKKHNIPYRENHIARMNFRQIFVHDPNGITLELNFTGA